MAGFERGFLNSVAQGPTAMPPHLWNPYVERTLPHPVLVNSPRLHSLIHEGKLELSLADALALTLENDLDIVVQRYIVPFAQTDILRTKSGQAARSFTGALYPSELNSGAIGAGVTNGGGAGGTGNAGGITGGGGAVSVGAAGAFDPSVSFGMSYDRVTSPLNSLIVSGIPTTTSSAIAYSASYAQMFTTGASYSVSLSTLRQNSTQENLLYNPDVTSRLSIGFNQPLLAGFGRMANERFITVARNNVATADQVFKQQVITSVVQLEDAYYGLAAFQLNVQVAEESLKAVQQLDQETRKQEEAGVMSHLDVVTADSQLAASQRDLLVAQTNLEQQETTLKQLLSKRDDPDLDSAQIVVTGLLPQPREQDLPNLAAAVSMALANRPEIKIDDNNLKNQDTAIAYAKNNLMPSLAAFGLYASSGLQGTYVPPAAAVTAAATPGKTFTSGGAVGSLGQSFGGTYPETATGVSFGAAIRNRSAQADNIRSQLERNQLEISEQSTRNQINLQVQQSRIGLIQGKVQVEAAQEAVRLAQESRDAEQEKLRVGLSTAYNVILKERDLVSAQYTAVQVQGAYANALIAMDQATGTTLERNGIRLDDALSGIVTSTPTPPYQPPAPSPAANPARRVQ
jgi:outer membrane protein